MIFAAADRAWPTNGACNSHHLREAFTEWLRFRRARSHDGQTLRGLGGQSTPGIPVMGGPTLESLAFP
jgi:hypothetical protein